jgi:hypothetical protein
MNRWSEFFVIMGIGILLLIGASKLRIEEGELPEVIIESPELNYEEEIIEEPESYFEYHVIAGSFTDEQNAKEFIEELELIGYYGKILVSEDFLYRVSIFSSDVEDDCFQFKTQVPKTLRVWTLFQDYRN